MKIGISLLSAREDRTGVENVAFNLIRKLSEIDPDNEYVVYANKTSRNWGLPETNNIKIVDVKLSYTRYRWLWEHMFFLMGGNRERLDLVHFPMGGGVVGYKGKFVLTIHDLMLYSMKNLSKLRRHLLYRFWCNANIERAAKIITVSEYVKNDILKHFDIPQEAVRVIHNGVDERFKPYGNCRPFRMRYALPDEYILFVGQTTPNKNLTRAIEAVKLVHEKYNLNPQLIVAGPPGYEDEFLKKYVRAFNLDNIVRFCGYVTDADMPQLYSNARAFLFPSIAEGFGIPPIEAMSCGIPVVAAAATSLPEILGEAAIWVNPFSTDSIAEGIRKALADNDVRTTMVRRGLLRARAFTWGKMAAETLKVYREIGECQ